MTLKPCVYPGCDQPRKQTKSGKPLTMCAEHFSEYGRRRYTQNWDGWLGERKAKVPRTPKRTKRAPTPPALPAPELTPAPMRIIALRCAICCIKYPHTDEHFDVAAQAQTCRHCADVHIITIVDPISSTARRARLLIADEPVSCGEGAEAYAAFARAEKAAGHHVVIQW